MDANRPNPDTVHPVPGHEEVIYVVAPEKPGDWQKFPINSCISLENPGKVDMIYCQIQPFWLRKLAK